MSISCLQACLHSSGHSDAAEMHVWALVSNHNFHARAGMELKWPSMCSQSKCDRNCFCSYDSFVLMPKESHSKMYNHENITEVNHCIHSIHQGLKRHNCAVFCKLLPHAVDITIYNIVPYISSKLWFNIQWLYCECIIPSVQNTGLLYSFYQMYQKNSNV